MMGTFIEVTSPDKEAAGVAFAEIQRVEGLLSKYAKDSEISRLNKAGRLKVSPETFYVVKKSKEFWQLSQGAFDISVAPLLDLWGFTDKDYRIPQDSQVKEAMKAVGSDKIILQESDNVIEFSVPNMKIDLGAIAKGYALDCAIKKLKEKGVKSCLINAGGQVSCLGDNSARPWRVALKNPRARGVTDYLELKDKSVSTSGDYEQYFIEGRRRYSHIFDPRTGYPVEGAVASVTVLADTGLDADALSTAIFVLGKEKGMELAQRLKGVEVLWQ